MPLRSDRAIILMDDHHPWGSITLSFTFREFLLLHKIKKKK